MALLTDARLTETFPEFCLAGPTAVVACDFSFAVDDHHDRQALRLKLLDDRSSLSQNDRICDPGLVCEISRFPDRIVDVHSDDKQSLVLVLHEEFLQDRHSLAARRTPRGPEIEQDYLASRARKPKLPATQILQNKIRSHLAGKVAAQVSPRASVGRRPAAPAIFRQD